ncbi:MAG: Crp/Fnr family transcriptional regulator, partial [Hydrogenophaga sp.]|nr:Crp/Fnr family transcriptional regulator [Hydrogenophaga sp.]
MTQPPASLSPGDWQRLRQLYPALPAADVEYSAPLPVLHAPEGMTLFQEDQACQGFPLVLEGE